MLHFDLYGSGSPLLLLHGWLFRGEMFRPLIRPLAERHQLIVPDLRGYGRSQHLPGPYRINQYVQDLESLLNRLGVETLDVLGYSKGGLVAQQLAYQLGLRIRKLILACTYAHKPLTLQEQIERRLFFPVYRQVGRPGAQSHYIDEWIAWFSRLDPHTMRWYRRMIADNRDEIILMGFHEAYRFDSRGWLDELKQPTLVLGGDVDWITPLHHTYLLARTLPNARVQIVRGAGHGLIHTHTQQAATAIEAFLAQDGVPSTISPIRRRIPQFFRFSRPPLTG